MCIRDSPRIDNEFFRTLASYQGTSQRLTTAHRPQGKGQAEAINKELVTKLKIYCSSYPYDWDVKVHHLAYAYNTTVHSVTGETPFFCMHGYHPSSAYTLYLPSVPPCPAQGASRYLGAQ